MFVGGYEAFVREYGYTDGTFLNREKDRTHTLM